jgi:pilus assembly protein CpaF
MSTLFERVERSKGGEAQPAQPAKPAEPESLLPAVYDATTRTKNAARHELLLSVRRLLQDEVVRAFNDLADVPETEIRARVSEIADRVITGHGFAVTRDERLGLVQVLVDEVIGFGPIEPYLKDESITEVMVNGPQHVYIERRGKIVEVESSFLDDEHVLRVIDRIITPIGRRIDESSPRVDARLPDGSRVNAIIAPLSLIGPVITIRKFSTNPYTVDDLVRFGTASPEMFDFLRACVEARLNLFVSGGTGSGKTTTLNVLSSFIPEEERIVTIEDAAELQLRQEHVITLESRPANLEGLGEITIRHLLRNAMHMRPDRVIVGECRGGEALDMLNAMTSGHDGSLSTGHANSPADMLRRLETMVLMTGYELPLRAIREQISSAVDLIVHTARMKDGKRRITNITEVYGIEDDQILMQDIFAFHQTGVVDGVIQGDLAATGIRPLFMDQFKRSGVELPPDEFGIPPADPTKQVRVRGLKSRWGGAVADDGPDLVATRLGRGRTVTAGGMVYISSVGPIDLESGRLAGESMKAQAHQALANLKQRLEGAGSSLEKVVWVNWALRDPGDFDAFNEEWVQWFPGDMPVGQGTLLPVQQRRAGFRISLGVIAEA